MPTWDPMSLFTGAGAGLAVAAVVGFIIQLTVKKRMGALFSNATKSAQQILEDARKEAENVVKSAELKAKEDQLQQAKQFDKDQHRRRVELERSENRLRNKERTLDQKIDQADKREAALRMGVNLFAYAVGYGG